MPRPIRVAALLAALLGLIGLVSACGNDEPEQSTSDPKIIEVSVEGGQVDPSGDTVEADAGQEVVLEIKADKPDEIHVHSEPEQTHEYGAGTTRISLGEFDIPGRFPVEIHNLDATVLTLKVQ